MIRTILATAAVAAGLTLAAPADAATAPAAVWASQSCIPDGFPHAGHVVVLWGVVDQSPTLSATITDSTRKPAELNGTVDALGMTAAYDVLSSTTRKFVTECAVVTFSDGSTRSIRARVHVLRCS